MAFWCINMRLFYAYLLFLFVLLNLNTLAQNTNKKFNHNLSIHPVIEGVAFKYEKVLFGKNSFKSSLSIKSNGESSLLYNLDDYKEQKLDFQLRHYFDKSEAVFSGVYNGIGLQYKQLQGFTRSSSISFPRKEYDNKAIGIGYVFGIQKMTASGLNFDLGYAIFKQFMHGEVFRTYLFNEVPYRPYNNLINSQLIIGIGIAF